MPVISALGSWRQEDQEFRTISVCIARWSYQTVDSISENKSANNEGRSQCLLLLLMSLCTQVFTFTWREDIRPGDPQHTKKFCFDAVSHTSPVTLYDCHSMKGNQLWKYRKVGSGAGWGSRPGSAMPPAFSCGSCPPILSAVNLALREKAETQIHAF